MELSEEDKSVTCLQPNGQSNSPDTDGLDATVPSGSAVASKEETNDEKETSLGSTSAGIWASAPGASEMPFANSGEVTDVAKSRLMLQENDVMLSHVQEGDDTSTMVQAGSVPPTTPGCTNCSHLLQKLHREEERCTMLRDNIHKVSANWFQRKTQLSESENEAESPPPVPLLSATKKMADGEEDEEEGMSEKAINRSKDLTKLMNIIAQKSAQLDLADNLGRDLKKRMREYEKIIDDKEDIIHGLKDQLETYLTDNQNMSVQLNSLACLFQQLEKVDRETVSVPQLQEADDDATATVPLPTQDDFHEMASSVSRTYIKLKDLIYEKKALVTEIERLNTLNVELQRRVVQQETRLVSVSDALHQTWLVVSDLKDQHAKLHDDELIMKYELKEKREILTKLRRELESARAQWQVIRQKNFESEQEYTSIREMLQERRKSSRDEQLQKEENKVGEEEPDEAVCLHPDDTKSFDPPVDLLLEMGLEYGIIGEDAEMTQTVLDVIRGEDVRNNRLEQLEEHCSLLYQKLLSSTSRSLSLAARLSRLHRQFSSSEDELDGEGEFLYEGEEGDEEEDQELQEGEGGEAIEDSDQEDYEEGEQEVQYYSDANHMTVLESVLSSPDSEEYDTAYVSETEGQDIIQAIPTAGDDTVELTETESQAGPSRVTGILDGDGDSEEASLSAELEENCDHLSRKLINFLPRKIEFLKTENKKLELSMLSMKEDRERTDHAALRLEKEKEKLEEEVKALTKDMTMEKLQRIQLEQQLKHLGKCVDELKLKHQAEKTASEGTASKKQKQEGREELEQQGDEEVKEEPRESGERNREDEQMKREVELVKRAMELKKKEKELRRKEEEVAKRERELEERGCDSSAASRGDDVRSEEAASSPSHDALLPPTEPSPECHALPPQSLNTASEGITSPSVPASASLTAHPTEGRPTIARVGELVLLLLQRVSAVNPSIKENSSSGNTENDYVRETTPIDSSPPTTRTSQDNSQSQDTEHSTEDHRPASEDTEPYLLLQDPLLNRITLEPPISSLVLETRGPVTVETNVAVDDFLVIPLQLTVPGQQVTLRVQAPQNTTLLVLQSQSDSTAPVERSAGALPYLFPSLLVPPITVPPCGSCLRLTSRRHTITCLAIVTTSAGTATPTRVTYSASLAEDEGEGADGAASGQGRLQHTGLNRTQH